MRAPLVAILLGSASCGGETRPTPMCEVRTSLIDHHAWAQVPVDADPFRADGTRCPDERMRAEDLGGELSYTIETQRCRWGTASQTVAIPVAAGETVNYRLFYFSQTNFDAAQAEIVVSLADQPLWTRFVPLPSTTASLLYSSEPAPRAIAAGEKMYFHVENHGENSWNLMEVTVSRMEPCPESGGQ